MSPVTRRVRRQRLTAAIGALAVTSVADARAEGGYVSVGGLAGGVLARGDDASAWTLGGELSWAHYKSRCCWDGGVGAFLQAQRYFGDGGSNRFALGFQYPGPLGFEAGAGVRVGERGSSPQLHLAPFVSAGLVHVALRASPAVGPYGSEIALVIGFKLPVPYGHPPPSLSSPHGRPLLIAGAPRVAPLAVGVSSGWLGMTWDRAQAAHSPAFVSTTKPCWASKSRYSSSFATAGSMSV